MGVLEGNRVIVTGAGAGLGAAYAEQIAAAGASVIVNDLDGAHAEETAARIRERGGTARAFAGDVSDWDRAGALVEFCAEAYGGVDGLVNNAGIIGRVGSALDEQPDAAARVLRVNVLGTLFPTVHAVRAMRTAGRGGAVVNVSSGNQSGHAEFATYGASKGAVSSLTYAWASEFGAFGVRVNAISPNAHTGMTDELEAQLGTNPEARDYPTPEQNAAVVVYLLSELSTALTGQVVRVDNKRVSVTSHPFVVSPRVEIEMDAAGIAEAFRGPLADRIQPLGISIAEVAHLEQLY